MSDTYGSVLPAPTWSTRARADMDDRERNHVAAIGEVIRQTGTPAEKAEWLAAIHEEFGRPDMAQERRDELACADWVDRSRLHAPRTAQLPPWAPRTVEAPDDARYGGQG